MLGCTNTRIRFLDHTVCIPSVNVRLEMFFVFFLVPNALLSIMKSDMVDDHVFLCYHKWEQLSIFINEKCYLCCESGALFVCFKCFPYLLMTKQNKS